MQKRTIKELGESGIINIFKRKTRRIDRTVKKGIGDDCAVLEYSKDKYMLFASDMLIEGRHFIIKPKKNSKRLPATSYQIGHKALAVNISDVAAMGGEPKYAVVSLGLPARLTADFLTGLARGMSDISKRFRVSVVGGDTNRSDKLVIDVAIIGFVEKEKLVKRDGAKEGDAILVSGRLGGSQRSRHLTFIPCVKESRYLVGDFKVNSMIDISDGLAIDLHRLLDESGKGADICGESIPMSRGAAGIDSALNEGEDFQLLFTMTQKEAKRLDAQKSKHAEFKFTRIGKVLKKKNGVHIIKKGSRALLDAKGYRHF